MKARQRKVSSRTPSVDAVRNQLERILGSDEFSNSPRLSAFLNHIVEQKLQGAADQLKEYSIGIEVFERGHSFDPRTDTIGRVQARRLRQRLADYYTAAGRDDSLAIEVPKGGYVPHFHFALGPHLVETSVANPQGESPQRLRDPAEDSGRILRTVHTSRSIHSHRGILSEDTSALIAVLPFENRSPTEEDEYFSDGITEDVISTLGKIEELRVVPRTSVLYFKGRRPNYREVARALNADYVLVGSVRRSANRLRITVELISTQGGEQVWTERYDRVLEDIFDVQEEISREIAGYLHVRFAEGRSPTTALSTPAFEAYRRYLQGRHTVPDTESHLRQKIALFEESLEIDPSYVDPHLGLADTFAFQGIMGYSRPSTVMEKARHEALRAMELEATTAGAHASLGLVLYWYDWDFRAAERAYRRAIKLDTRDPLPHVYRGELLCEIGDADEGVGELRRAVELDPLSPFTNMLLCYGLVCAHDFESVLDHGLKTLEITPGHGITLGHMAMAYRGLGRKKDAVRTLESAALHNSHDPVFLGWLGVCQASADRKSEALDTIKRLEILRHKRYCAASPIAWIYAELGALDLAFEWLETAVEERDGLLMLLKRHPVFGQPFRADKRYRAFTRTIGFPR